MHWSEQDNEWMGWRGALPTLFSGINDVDGNTARRRFQARQLQPGEVLCREGEPANELVCVCSGQLEIRCGDQVLAQAGPDDLVGEMALFENGVRSATVIARADTQILTLDRAGYEALRDTVHPLVLNIELIALHHQVTRLRATGARVAKVSQGTPVEPIPLSGRFKSALRRIFGSGGILGTAGEPRKALAQSDLFGGVPEDFLDMLADAFRPKQVQPGTLLCSQGEVGSRMFVLESGAVDVVVGYDLEEPRRVASLGPGAAFGMVALAVPGPRMASVIAREPSLLHELDKAGWDKLAHHPWGPGSAFRRAVIRAFGRQLADTNAQLVAWERDHRLEDLERASAALA